MSELSQMAELLGTEATVALIEAHGGTRLSVPRKADGACQLREAMGDAGFLRLVQYFGGSVLTVPLARAWRARIYRAREMTYAQIARACGVTESAVYKMLDASEASSGQRGRPLRGRPRVAGQGDMFPE